MPLRSLPNAPHCGEAATHEGSLVELMPTPCGLLEQTTTEFRDLNWAVAFAEALLRT